MKMRRVIGPAALATLLLSACSSMVAPHAVAWRAADKVITPETNPEAAVGGLVVETDTDLAQNGGQTFYNIRRPYEVYAEDGTLVRRVENQGARSGEEPVLARLAPGRYVVASTVGTVYRRVEVEVRRGLVTRVTEDSLRTASPVFGS